MAVQKKIGQPFFFNLPV